MAVLAEAKRCMKDLMYNKYATMNIDIINTANTFNLSPLCKELLSSLNVTITSLVQFKDVSCNS